jgi:hypothetical protein
MNFAKLLSGRWILTVVAALVFGWTAIAGTMEAADVKMLLGIIVTFYFMRSDRAEPPK